jgi:hypothetical protein
VEARARVLGRCQTLWKSVKLRYLRPAGRGTQDSWMRGRSRWTSLRSGCTWRPRTRRRGRSALLGWRVQIRMICTWLHYAISLVSAERNRSVHLVSAIPFKSGHRQWRLLADDRPWRLFRRRATPAPISTTGRPGRTSANSEFALTPRTGKARTCSSATPACVTPGPGSRGGHQGRAGPVGLEESRVVRTSVPLGDGTGRYRLGSGYLVADGLVLTAAHIPRARGAGCRPSGRGPGLLGRSVRR